jgi:hypothetical protein
MSLDWNISEIKDHETMCFEDRIHAGRKKSCLSAVTESIIWYTIGVGLGEITEKNIEEWMFRMKCIDLTIGALLTVCEDDGPKYVAISEDTVRKHIGLKTNVTNESRSKWWKKFMATVERNIDARHAATFDPKEAV